MEKHKNEKEEKVKAGAEDPQRILEETRKQLDEANQQAAEAKDKMLRAFADFENAKKRLAKEREEFVRFSSETMMRGLLPILDNFERAIAHADAAGEPANSPLREGVMLIKKQLADFLVQQGLSRIESVGKPFDPQVHEAMGHVETEEHPDETVVDEYEPGYLLKGRLLRPAKVRIAKNQPAHNQEPGKQ